MKCRLTCSTAVFEPHCLNWPHWVSSAGGEIKAGSSVFLFFSVPKSVRLQDDLEEKIYYTNMKEQSG